MSLHFRAGQLVRDPMGNPVMHVIEARDVPNELVGAALIGRTSFASIDADGLVFAGLRNLDTGFWVSQYVFNQSRAVWANGAPL